MYKNPFEIPQQKENSELKTLFLTDSIIDQVVETYAKEYNEESLKVVGFNFPLEKIKEGIKAANHIDNIKNVYDAYFSFLDNFDYKKLFFSIPPCNIEERKTLPIGIQFDNYMFTKMYDSSLCLLNVACPKQSSLMLTSQGAYNRIHNVKETDMFMTLKDKTKSYGNTYYFKNSFIISTINDILDKLCFDNNKVLIENLKDQFLSTVNIKEQKDIFLLQCDNKQEFDINGEISLLSDTKKLIEEDQKKQEEYIVEKGFYKAQMNKMYEIKNKIR